MYKFENKYSSRFQYIAGGDEAGRGCLAGPVAAALVILDPAVIIPGLKDSKLLTAARRELLFEAIKAKALAWAVGLADHNLIDQINILEATKKAFIKAYNRINIKPDFILFDALKVDALKVAQLKLIKGESKSASIAAASIMAKVSRDRLMVKYAENYPGYGFAKHKGYGTRKHRVAIAGLGPCSIHRKTFRPVSAYVSD
ncbi:MAG TPA: ribonuclease HII [Spirochaetota bacterium]|nr:ribonuclease HII [Spirochaetota bacterium]